MTPPARPGIFGLSGRFALAVWVVLALSVGGLVYGLRCMGGFDSNLLAEGVGIPIALTFLNRLADEQRRTQWSAVSAQVGRSIATIAHEITFEIWSRLPREAKQYAKNPVLIPPGNGLADIISSLARACQHVATMQSQSTMPSQAYEAVEPTLRYLSGVLAPRVAMAGVDLALLARLADVEDAGRQWAYAVRLAELPTFLVNS